MRRNRFPVSEDTPFNWRVIFQLIPYLSEFKGRVFFAILCLVGAKVASVGLPFILKHIVDDLNLETPTEQLVAVPIALVVAYGIVRFANVLFGEIRDTLFGRVTERAMRRIGLKVFQHLHSLDLSFHLNRQTGGLSRDIERGTTGISFLLRFLIFNIGPTLIEIALVVGLLYSQYGFSFAAIIFGAVLLYITFSVKATDWRTKYVREVNQADSSSNSRAIDSLLNYETVKYFNNEDFESKRYDVDLSGWESARRKNRLTLFALNGGQALIISLAMTSMMLLAAINVTKETMTIGDFVLINAFTMQIFMPLNFLGFVYREVRGSLANIENMFSLLNRESKVVDTDDAQPLVVNSADIHFKQVQFHYEPERPILKGLDFCIKAGQKVAVVGESGAGKSTIIKLLFRFYDVTHGEINIDGQNISSVTQHSLRKHIAIVPQDTVLFNDTLFENVRYGRPDATTEEVNEAIRLAHLKQFIESLPKGKDTMVGERGLKLSGGEKQRVAIARAILKQSPILVFDEATSSLDSQSEQAILQALKEISLGHTSLVIAHRLSTIVDADNILVMENGAVVEQGTHTQLIQKEGLYKAMWTTQQKQTPDNTVGQDIG
ncbi:ABC transporter ATP-binding protein/permease [Alteromonadaceae bacterium M269]|nr:ABC transporter ATP-binding protein/permease [Alteromonadaceae bacterium M269]